MYSSCKVPPRDRISATKTVVWLCSPLGTSKSGSKMSLTSMLKILRRYLYHTWIFRTSILCLGGVVKKNCKSQSFFLIKMGAQDIFVSDKFWRESMTIVTTAYTWWWSIHLLTWRLDSFISFLGIFWDVPSTFFFGCCYVVSQKLFISVHIWHSNMIWV